jgi:hypothetical protein
MTSTKELLCAFDFFFPELSGSPVGKIDQQQGLSNAPESPF